MFPSGDVIQRRRKKLGMTQIALARKVGIGNTYLSEIESNKRDNVSEKIMRKICDVLDIPVEDGASIQEITPDVKIARLKAKIESRRHNDLECISEVHVLLDSLPEDTPTTTIGAMYVILANLYRFTYRYSETIEYAIKAQDIFSRTKNKLSWSQATYELAAATLEMGNYETALVYLYACEQRLQEMNYKGYWFTRIQNGIALTAAYIGDISLMHKYIKRVQDSIQHVPASEQDVILAQNDYLTGRVLLEAGAYEDAKDAYQNAEFRYRALNQNVNALRMYHNIAEAYFKAGDLHSAKAIALNVIKMSEEDNAVSSNMARDLLLLAEIALELRDYDDVDRCCEQILRDDTVGDGATTRCLRVLARKDRRQNDMAGFNRRMAEAMSLIKGKLMYQALAIEIMSEYMEANHMGDLF